jgi:hypothetical protein
VIDVMNLRLNQPFTLSPRRPGEGRVREADVLIRGAAHLTLPATSHSLPRKRGRVRVGVGPLPLPPEGRRGALVAGIEANRCRQALTND